MPEDFDSSFELTAFLCFLFSLVLAEVHRKEELGIMSLCAASYSEITASRPSSVRLHKATGAAAKRLRSKYFHGNLDNAISTRVRMRHKRVALIQLRSFLREGLECGTVNSDKELPVIKELDSWCSSHEAEKQPVQLEIHPASDSASAPVASEQTQEVLSLVKLPAARKIVQLLTAWEDLSERLSSEALKCHGSRLLLAALKFAVPAFHRDPYGEDGRLQFSRALEVAYILADLHMDAETISAGILRVAAGDTTSVFPSDALQRELGADTVHLLHNSLRVNQLPSHLDSLHDENASALRQYSLAYHDVRAIVIELASRLDGMRHASSFPKHRQQILALENMQVYAPLAHALGLGSLSQELEDMAFRILFPESYDDVENWLQSHWGGGEVIISESIRLLKDALESDTELQCMVESVNITGRRKSRFSTMKKLLKDGRRPEQVFDILGLRVIVFPRSGVAEEVGIEACYLAQNIVTKMWTEVPGRMKDYIAQPKKNGYASLHLAIFLTDYGPWNLPLEVQIRTSAMHAHAVAGAASHALYKGGLTDPQQVQRFKTIMFAAAKAAAYRLQHTNVSDSEADHVFRMFDKNNDGIISRKEFQDVFLELGADKADSCEIMDLLDTDSDGAVNAKELEELKRQVRRSRKLVEGHCYNTQLRKIEDMNKRGKNHEMTQLSVF